MLRKFATLMNWPEWACNSIAVLSVLVVFVYIVQTVSSKSSSKRSGMPSTQLNEFRWFQLKYLSVYLILMLADWLQGTNMYTLYSSYGVDIGTLFLTGFLSSAVLGTIVGVYVDRWGRKFGCVVFCVLEIVINMMEHVPSMPILLIGRILGGISTSLLFSSFESWMVSEHQKKKFPEELLNDTFAIASWGNGIVAIIAGILAQLAYDIAGDIGPFQLAILLTIVALIIIVSFWDENYGIVDHSSNESESAAATTCDEASNINTNVNSSFLVGISTAFPSFGRSFVVASQWIARNPSALFLGLSQAFFEGAVYTFVFLWVPVLMAAHEGDSIPTGLVFSCFMLAMTLGGMITPSCLALLTPSTSTSTSTSSTSTSTWKEHESTPQTITSLQRLSILSFVVTAMAMLIPTFSSIPFVGIFIAFLILEAMVGIYYAIGGSLRSHFYPENFHSTIMSIFRLPLNILVVIGTKATDFVPSKSPVSHYRFLFYAIVSIHLLAALFIGLQMRCTSQSTLCGQPSKKKEE